MPRPTIEIDQRIPFACFVEEVADGLEVSVCGELDIAAVEDFDRVATEVLAERPRAILVDLGGLSFLDSTGFLALLRLERDATAAGQTITFIRPSTAARRVLDLAGADRQLRIRG